MANHPDAAQASTTEGLLFAPGLGSALGLARGPRRRALVHPRVVFISGVAMLVGSAAGLIAQGLTRLIGLITNLSFYGRMSLEFVSPAENHLGVWVVGVPIVGA